MSAATTNACPAWCNAPHRRGANPNRQVHVNRWKSPRRSRRVPPLSVEVYLFDAQGVALCARGVLGKTMDYWLTAEEVRSLGRRLLEMADAAEAARS